MLGTVFPPDPACDGRGNLSDSSTVPPIALLRINVVIYTNKSYTCWRWWLLIIHAQTQRQTNIWINGPLDTLIAGVKLNSSGLLSIYNLSTNCHLALLDKNLCSFEGSWINVVWSNWCMNLIIHNYSLWPSYPSPFLLLATSDRVLISHIYSFTIIRSISFSVLEDYPRWIVYSRNSEHILPWVMRSMQRLSFTCVRTIAAVAFRNYFSWELELCTHFSHRSALRFTDFRPAITISQHKHTFCQPSFSFNTHFWFHFVSELIMI